MEPMYYEQTPYESAGYDTGEPFKGLTSAGVQRRRQEGLHNLQPEGMTKSVGKIIRGNVCTLFNLINVILAVAILLVGHPENVLFLGVALCNTLMGIIQELRAKRTLDRLAILSKTTVTVVRDSVTVTVGQEDIVLVFRLYQALTAQLPFLAFIPQIIHCLGEEANYSCRFLPRFSISMTMTLSFYWIPYN